MPAPIGDHGRSAFVVLAEPHRRHILDLLRERERPVGELVTHLCLAQPTVSKHLRLLRECGLVEVRVDAQRRLYRLRAAPLAEIDAWLTPYRPMWTARLDSREQAWRPSTDWTPAPPAPLTCDRDPDTGATRVG